MNKTTLIFGFGLLLVVVALLVGCRAISPTQSPLTSPQIAESPIMTSDPTAEGIGEAPVTAPEPEPDMAAVSGLLYTFTGKGPIPETRFYLTPMEDGLPAVISSPQSELGDVAGVSDAKGQFQLKNVPPGRYHIVVWAPYNWIVAVNSPDDQTPRVIELAAGESSPLGVVHVSWP